MKVLFSALCLLLPMLVTAQNQKIIDSLNRQLPNITSDHRRIEIYNSIAWQYRRANLEKNQHYAQKALRLAEKVDFTEGKVESYYAIGAGFMESQSYEKALTLYGRVLHISKKVKYLLGEAKGYNGLGALYQYQKNYPKSIKYYQKSLKIKQQIGNLDEIFNTYYNIGNAYWRWEKLDSAATYIHKSIQIALQLNHQSKAADSYDILALIKVDQGKIDEAFGYYDHAISMSEGSGNDAQTALLYNDKGYLYQKTREFKKALQSHNQALTLYQKIKYLRGYARVYSSIGRLYWRQAKYNEAIEYYHKALQIYTQLNRQTDIAKVYDNIGLIYSNQALYKKALDYHHLSLNIKLKLNNKHLLARSYWYIGLVYKDKNEYEKARKYYFKIIAMEDELDDEMTIAQINYSLGITYWYNGNYPKALDYYQKALSTYKKNNHIKEIAKCYEAIGIIHAQQQDYPLAMEFLLKSAKFRERLKNKNSLIYCYNNIGNLYEDNNDYRLAGIFFQKALKLSKLTNNSQGLADTYLNLGHLEVEKKNFPQAIVYFSKVKKMNHIDISARLQNKIYWGIACYYLGNLTQALALINEGMEAARKQHRLSLVKIAAKTQAKVYKALGNYKKAYQSYQVFKEASDSLHNVGVTRKIALLQAKHAFNKEKDSIQRVQTHEKALLNAKIIQKDLTNRLQYRTLLSVSLGLLVTLLFAFYTNKSRRVKQQLNNILINQQQELRYKNEVLEVSKEEITAQRDMLEEQKQVLSLYKDRTGQSFRAARRIQKAFLPTKECLFSIFSDFFVLYLPKDVVSGDFYWATEVNNTKVMVVGDCTGHGVPGAFTTMIAHKLLDQIINVEQMASPATILNKMQQVFQQKLMDDKNRYVDIGLDAAVLTIESNSSQVVQVTFAGARQSLNYILPQNNKIHCIRGTRKSIGGMRLKKREFANHQMLLPKGSLLYMGSDGFADQNNKASERFGTDRLLRILEKHHQLPMKRQKNKLMNILFKYMVGVEQRDDILWIGVKL
ncbi:tetratricopeptide repeat protein [uncultured Microscilla sp.]|uniref:tetratricopeptide repeat protein n=1 Tax=uncultured Microscilla sp. TaxID=432653 RepID=UPI002602355C|nr:tetratricopeptide repeat protein [uncultured Microscilla sp.]